MSRYLTLAAVLGLAACLFFTVTNSSFAYTNRSSVGLHKVGALIEAPAQYAALSEAAKVGRRLIKSQLRKKKCKLSKVLTKKEQNKCVKKALKKLDPDKDGVTKKSDNCAEVANEDQANPDGDEFGDLCDNCPNRANTDQADSDSDGTGDACETDTDPSV